MNRNKILSILLGTAILSGLVCTALIIATGIQHGNAAPANASSMKREKFPQPYQLEKTKIDEFSELSLQLDYSNVSIIPSDGYYLEYCLDGTNKEPEYEIKDGKLSFQEGKPRQDFHFSWNLFGYPKGQEEFYLNLYVPKGQAFDSAALRLESGDLSLGQMEAKTADFSLEYGNLTGESLSGENLTIGIESGNLEIGAIRCDNLQIKAEYGNVTGDSFTASGQADIKLDSGNLELSQLSAGDFRLSNEYGGCTVDSYEVTDGFISMDSGNLKLRKAAMGNLEILSAYGNVDLSLAGDVSDPDYDMEVEYGTLKIGGKTIDPDEDGCTSYTDPGRQKDSSILIQCESGNVTVK